MTPARWPRGAPSQARMLHLQPSPGRWRHARVAGLAEALRPGDLVVVNDAATLPAVLRGATRGQPLELRLAGALPRGTWHAVAFGAGDWRTRTEERPPAPALVPGDRVELEDLGCTVVAVDAAAPRLIELRFDRAGAALYAALYRVGHPVQYAYVRAPLELWHVQTAFGARPWAVEPPSAGLSLTWAVLAGLRERGVGLARVTHAAGLSSTGDPALDARLPFPERYDVPQETVDAIRSAKGRGRRVLAVGTTVTRALEGAAAAHGGSLRGGEGWTPLRLGPTHRRVVVDGILTGIHAAGSSHYGLLTAFAPRALLDAAHADAATMGYEEHEFGDTLLILDA